MADSNSTKSALADAMKKLMVRKSFAKISISDLCEECGLNRKSFYYHFKDKYDLVNWIFYVDFLTNMGGKNFENEWDARAGHGVFCTGSLSGTESETVCNVLL